MSSGRKHLVVLALAALAMQVLLGLLLARIYLTSQNTLHNNGRWVSSKTLVSRALLGAESFVRERQALAGNRLDLSAWHGNQEVLLDHELPIERLELDFQLEAGAWIAIYFDKPAKRPALALRFSTVKARPSALLQVTPQGEFLANRPLRSKKVEPGSWHRLELRYLPDRVVASLNGSAQGEFTVPERQGRRIGFRGSAKRTLVDNVEVRAEDGTVIRERFDGPRQARRIQVSVVAGVVGINLLVGLPLLARARRRGRVAGFAYAMVTTTLIAVATLVLAFLSLKGSAYPLADELEVAERQTRYREIDRVRAQVLRRYTSEASTSSGSHRILLVGSSQTWGSGAARSKHVWSEVLESRLNADRELVGRFECINTGIASARSFHLSKALEEDWLALEPATVVINLGTNDTDLEAFALHIARLLELSLKAGAEPLLILEPNSPEYWVQLGERHSILERLGEEKGVPVLDMHTYLSDRHDLGFLWWDLAHLTSFGQRLFAERLHEELVRLQLVS